MFKKIPFVLLALFVSLSVNALAKSKPSITHEEFLQLLLDGDPIEVEKQLIKIRERWSPELTPMMLEVAEYTNSPYISEQLISILADKTEEPAKAFINDWHQWSWNQPVRQTADYSEFKAGLYQYMDKRFARYFAGRQHSARIRLDEIRWGGVQQDGIPPLRNPQMLSAKQADYLEDDNIVFGVKINGIARAYPKRILAWHEMFTDTFDGEPIAGVYCTLCGTVIIYKTRHNKVDHQLGTSGFLYRSNKLMYDQATQSLWSTVRGEPVLGDLVDKGIALEHLSVVTTTWGEWKRRHPDTTVLSLETGHRRDYGEGVAYEDYFSTDRLMFNTPFNDNRLKNKQEVLALRFAAAPEQQLAIDTDFLQRNPIFYERIGQQTFVVLTDKSGANRVYESGDIKLRRYDQLDTAWDENGGTWQLQESALVNKKSGEKLKRLPYHRAFWFGWLAAFPDTRLIK